MNDYDTIINNTYRIIRPIGSGGTGIIYLAEHINLRKMVVLKKIKASLANSNIVRQEADVLKSLHHMYLPQVYDFIDYDSEIYTVIDYIDGYDLQHYVDNGTAFSEAQLVKWMKQMCDALGYLHSHAPPIYHNDIKPANIIINNSEDICLIDFNISSDSSDTVNGFTAEYASPEQYYKVLTLLGQIQQNAAPGISAASDLYSLGASFYVLACRRRIDVYSVIDGRQPPMYPGENGFSEGFCDIINNLISPDPTKRYQSAGALKKALDALKKQDARYRKYLALRSCSLFLSGMMVVGGIWLIYMGNMGIKKETFSASYEKFCSEYNDGAYQTAAEDGMYILSNDEWKRFIDDSTIANINYMVGMSCFKIGEYSNANSYLDRAIRQQTDKNLRNGIELEYSVVLAYESDFAAAEEMLIAAYNDGVSYERYIIASARIYMAKGDYGKIKEIYQYAFSGMEMSVSAKAELYEVYGDVMRAEKDYSDAVLAYSNSKELVESTTISRKLADTYISLSETQFLQHEIIASLEKSAEIYETLASSELHSSADIINLAKVYRLLGSKNNMMSYYDSSIRILEQAQSEFPDDYRVYVQLAYTYNGMRNDDMARYYCELAKEKRDLYSSGPGENDADDSDLAKLMDLYGS